MAVRIVQIELAQPPEIAAAYDQLLPEAERSSRPEIRMARAATRDVLSRVLGTDAATLTIDRTCAHCADPAHGKPVVPGAQIAFSLSHSGTVGVLAWTSEPSAIGADVEIVRPRPHLDRLAARVLDPAELGEWERTPEPHQLENFLRAWTAKEAYLKATGEGIISAAATRPRDHKGWTIKPLTVPAGYVGALAIDRAAVELTFEYWDPSLRMAELQAHPGTGARHLRD